jgi:hypothetical protein
MRWQLGITAEAEEDHWWSGCARGLAALLARRILVDGLERQRCLVKLTAVACVAVNDSDD